MSELDVSTLIKTIKELIEEDKLEEIRRIYDSVEELRTLPYHIKSQLETLEKYLQELMYEIDTSKLGEFVSFDEIPTLLETTLSLQKEVDKIISRLDGMTLSDASNLRDQLLKIIKNLEPIRAIARNIGWKAVELEKNAKQYAFSVKDRDTKQFLENTSRQLKNASNRLMEFSKSFDTLFQQLISLYLPHTESPIITEDNIIIPIATNIQVRLSEGLRSVHLLDILTGLKSITAKPEEEDVVITLPDKPDKMSLATLFYRYPPFEPIHINKEGITGNLLWFINGKNVRIPSEAFTAPIDDSFVIYGDVDLEQDPVKLKSVIPINVLGDEIRKYILVTVYENNRRVWLKYGSPEIKARLKKGEDIQEIDEEYRKKMQTLGRRAYLGTNLSYVWYCKWGIGMSNNPWDVTCPFQRWCFYGKQREKRCPKWSWSRRIHPKVFAYISRLCVGCATRDRDYMDTSLVEPIAGKGVLIREDYKGIQFSLPESNVPLQIEFKRPIGRILPKTNVIGFSIRKDLLVQILISILDFEVPGNYTIEFLNKQIPLRDLILSKYYLSEKTERGLRSYQLLQQSSERIIQDYEKFREMFEKEFKFYLEGHPSILVENVIDWGVYTFLHSLAHMFLGFVSTKLEINPEDLLYLVDVDDYAGKVLVAENSQIGAMNIVKAAEIKFGNLETLILQFFNEITNGFISHEIDLKNYEEEVKRKLDVIKDKLGKNENKYSIIRVIVDKLQELYRSFLEKGLVLDQHLFSTHLLLTDEYEKLLDEIIAIGSIGSEDEKEKLKSELIKDFDTIITLMFPRYCVDGCLSCVMLDRGCTEGLGQGLSVSKELTKFISEILFFKRKFRGKGNILLKNLISALVTRELVALSPYIDEEGINFLNSLSERGIHVKLITTRNMVNKFNNELKNSKFEVYIWDSDHDKGYIIDNKIVISTTANLNLYSSRVNSFEFIKFNNSNLTEILKKAKRVEK